MIEIFMNIRKVILIAVSITLSTAGCVAVIPVPERLVYRDGVSARVMDGKTHTPVSNAKITLHFEGSPADGKRGPIPVEDHSLCTNEKGEFSLPEDAHQVAFWIIGMPGEVPVPAQPEGKKKNPNTMHLLRLQIEANGYATFIWNSVDKTKYKVPEEIFLEPKQSP